MAQARQHVLPQFGTSSMVFLTDEEIVEKASKARNGQKFKQYVAGDWSDKVSRSEADLAFASMIAFYTNDGDQILRII